MMTVYNKLLDWTEMLGITLWPFQLSELQKITSTHNIEYGVTKGRRVGYSTLLIHYANFMAEVYQDRVLYATHNTRLHKDWDNSRNSNRIAFITFQDLTYSNWLTTANVVLCDEIQLYNYPLPDFLWHSNIHQVIMTRSIEPVRTGHVLSP